MADCKETIRELGAFLDGELSADVREQIDHHLGGCVDCHQAFDFEAELKLTIQRKLLTEEMPEGLLERIRQCFDTDLSDPSPTEG
jgi:anti-sigma factor (TIGR02949 family)